MSDGLRELAEEIGKLTGAHLLAGSMGAAAGYVFRVAQEMRKRRALHRSVTHFFGLKGERLFIIHSAMLDTTRSAYNLPCSDTRAARAIAKVLESAGKEEGTDFEILPEGEFVAKFKKLTSAADNDLVFLCGPKRNALVAELLHLTPNLRYQLTRSPETGENVLYDRSRNAQLISSRDVRQSGTSDDDASYDFGMILSMPSPLDIDRRIVILAGIHGSGTLGAALYAADPPRLASLCKRREHGVIQEVVRAEYEDNPDSVSNVTLV